MHMHMHMHMHILIKRLSCSPAATKRREAFWHAREAVAMRDRVGSRAMLMMHAWHLAEGQGVRRGRGRCD